MECVVEVVSPHFARPMQERSTFFGQRIVRFEFKDRSLARDYGALLIFGLIRL
jgi:hypothetical protein